MSQQTRQDPRRRFSFDCDEPEDIISVRPITRTGPSHSEIENQDPSSSAGRERATQINESDDAGRTTPTVPTTTVTVDDLGTQSRHDDANSSSSSSEPKTATRIACQNRTSSPQSSVEESAREMVDFGYPLERHGSPGSKSSTDSSEPKFAQALDGQTDDNTGDPVFHLSTHFDSTSLIASRRRDMGDRSDNTSTRYGQEASSSSAGFESEHEPRSYAAPGNIPRFLQGIHGDRVCWGGYGSFIRRQKARDAQRKKSSSRR